MKAYSAIWLTGLALAALPAAARADRLDKKLNEEMPSVKKYLDEKGYRNVGVLRFRVQKAKGTARFDNAPYNGNLPARIENLLVIHGGDDESKLIGVIHDAGAAAAKAKVGDWFGDEKERKKLFEVSYPLAWGKKKVKPDAFLTGLVRVSADQKKVTFTLSCFDKDNLEPRTVKEFTLATDRDIVRDLGASYKLGKKARESLVARRSMQDVDRNVVDAVQDEGGGGGVVDDVRKDKGKDKDKDDKKDKDKDEKKDKDKDGGRVGDDEPKTKPKRDTQATPSDVAGIEVTVLVDKKEVDIMPAKGDGPGWELKSPAQGKSIAIRLRNTTEKTMGVVLKLNGVSTFDEQKESPDQCRKWVIKPGKTAMIRGFYTPQGEELSLSPFKVLVGEEAKDMRAHFGDRAGLIEVDVYAEGGETGGDEELAVSSRGMPPSKEKAARASYKALRAALLKSAKLKTETTEVKTENAVVKREIIVPDKDALRPGGKFKVVDFDSYCVGRLAVKVVGGEYGED